MHCMHGTLNSFLYNVCMLASTEARNWTCSREDQEILCRTRPTYNIRMHACMHGWHAWNLAFMTGAARESLVRDLA